MRLGAAGGSTPGITGDWERFAGRREGLCCVEGQFLILWVVGGGGGCVAVPGSSQLQGREKIINLNIQLHKQHYKKKSHAFSEKG